MKERVHRGSHKERETMDRYHRLWRRTLKKEVLLCTRVSEREGGAQDNHTTTRCSCIGNMHSQPQEVTTRNAASHIEEGGDATPLLHTRALRVSQGEREGGRREGGRQGGPDKETRTRVASVSFRFRSSASSRCRISFASRALMRFCGTA